MSSQAGGARKVETAWSLQSATYQEHVAGQVQRPPGSAGHSAVFRFGSPSFALKFPRHCDRSECFSSFLRRVQVRNAKLCGKRTQDDGGCPCYQIAPQKKEMNAKDSPKVTEARELSKLGS